MSELAGRVALVTGGGSGIGRAVVQRLLDDGMDVVNADLSPPPDAAGSALQVDLTTRVGNRRAVEAALERFGRLDVVVANAGVQHVSPVREFDEDRWDRLISLLLTSPFLLAKYAWDALAEHGDGRFIAIASAHGLVASPYKSAYISAKHGVIGLVKTLALEGAEAGVLATAVCPAYVRTPLVEAQISAQAEAHGLPEERVLEDVILAPQPIKRLIEPAEVAGVVAFLAGPAGGAFSGVPVTMDLGWTAR
jgi:3-hydroxybutyrate dehydrogenase